MPDLIDDGTWREAALARMSEVFVTNRGLRPLYLLMASTHRYAIDYIEQATVIVLASARGNAQVSRTERAFIQEQFRNMCQSKARLRDVMQSYGLPLPLRQLDGRVLTASRATAVRRLALMNPSTLAHIIPAARQKQNAWLHALQNWCEGMAHRSEPNDYRCLHFEWAATNRRFLREKIYHDPTAEQMCSSITDIYDRKFYADVINWAGSSAVDRSNSQPWAMGRNELGFNDLKLAFSGESGISGRSPEEDRRNSEHTRKCCNPERKETRGVLRHPQRFDLMTLIAFFFGALIGGSVLVGSLWLERYDANSIPIAKIATVRNTPKNSSCVRNFMHPAIPKFHY